MVGRGQYIALLSSQNQGNKFSGVRNYPFATQIPAPMRMLRDVTTVQIGFY